MASYSVLIKRSAEKELRAVPKPDLSRIIHRIRTLALNPRSKGAQKLSGEEKYRVRQGDWRVVYSIDEERKVVEVVKVGHRKEIYRP